MSLETTTHVRTLRGLTPTEGSHWIHKTSPRLYSVCSRLIVVEQIELSLLQVLEQRARIFPPRGVILRYRVPPLGRLSSADRLFDQLASQTRSRSRKATCVLLQTRERVFVECQI